MAITRNENRATLLQFGVSKGLDKELQFIAQHQEGKIDASPTLLASILQEGANVVSARIRDAEKASFEGSAISEMKATIEELSRKLEEALGEMKDARRSEN